MKLRIALAQLPGVRLDQWASTLDSIGEAIRSAAECGAHLVLLPECVWPAYCIGSKAAYFSARSAGMPGQGTFLERLSGWARQYQIMICAGYIEDLDDRLGNAACLIDRSGDLLGTYRKCFLWDFDHDWFEPGDRIEPVDTQFGRIGMMICADNRLPEIPATLVARGAQLIVQPTAWVNVPAPGEELWNPQPAYLNAARAIEFGVPVAACSKWGVEGETTFVGMSRTYDANGTCLAQLGGRESGIALAEVELSTPHAAAGARHSDALRTIEYTPPRKDVDRAHVRITNAEDGSLAGVTIECGGQSAALRSATPAPIVCGKAAVGAVAADDATDFAAIRLLALRGAHFVAVLGRGVPTPILRARATENRIFVASATDPIYAPTGLPVPSANSDSRGDARYELDLREAARKQVARDTDTLAGREPGHYKL